MRKKEKNEDGSRGEKRREIRRSVLKSSKREENDRRGQFRK